MNICYITDNNYVQHTLVSMTSLLANKFPTSRINVHVVCDCVDSWKKDMMMRLNQDGFNVTLIDRANTFTKKEKEVSKYISASTYIRLNLPSIFPNLEKLLYLDGDVIVQGDLSELYDIDMSRSAIAGILDYGICVDGIKWSAIQYIRDTMPVFETEYINGGVLLMNLSELRKCNFEHACQKLYDERTDFIFADQDIINFALLGKKCILPIYWNCPVLSLLLNYGKHESNFLHERIAKIYHIAYKDIMDIVFRSRIIHINGIKKHMHNVPYLKEMYERYLELAMSYMKEDVQ